MPTADEVGLATHDSVQAELRLARRNASPWPDKKLGNHGGAGYNFSNRTLRPFVKDCYAALKRDPVMAGTTDKFDVPVRLPVGDLLGKAVSNLEQFIASDVCGQLGL